MEIPGNKFFKKEIPTKSMNNNEVLLKPEDLRFSLGDNQ
jgi:hypothetical protein